MQGENSKAGQLDKRQKVDEGTSLGMQDIPAHVEVRMTLQAPAPFQYRQQGQLTLAFVSQHPRISVILQFMSPYVTHQ